MEKFNKPYDYMRDECKVYRICKEAGKDMCKPDCFCYKSNRETGKPFKMENNNPITPLIIIEEICPCCGERSSEKGKELCAKCSEPKKQSTSGEIREAFVKWWKDENLDEPGCDLSKGDARYSFKAGYKAAQEKSKCEIEEIQISARAQANMYFDKIKDLEQQLSAMQKYIDLRFSDLREKREQSEGVDFEQSEYIEERIDELSRLYLAIKDIKK